MYIIDAVKVEQRWQTMVSSGGGIISELGGLSRLRRKYEMMCVHGAPSARRIKNSFCIPIKNLPWGEVIILVLVVTCRGTLYPWLLAMLW